MSAPATRGQELSVLALISGGLIVILLVIVLGLYIDNNGLPNWAENVLVSIATASALKLGDCVAALVALATGRQVENLGHSLAQSGPAVEPPPQSAAAAAKQTAEAAADKAEQIEAATAPDAPEGERP